MQQDYPAPSAEPVCSRPVDAMTNLSPAAAAVLDAYGDFEPANVDAMAAALRAAADQVVPECAQPSYGDDFSHGAWFARDDVRDDLLRIAAELEPNAQ